MRVRDLRRQLPALAAFALPIVLVKATGLLTSPRSTVAEAPAPARTPAPAVAPAPEAIWTDAEREAARYARARRVDPFGSNPFHYPSGSASGATPAPPPGRDLVASGIMRAANGDHAIINGRVYAEGDRVRGTSWTVRTVSEAERSVTLERDDGATRRLSVGMPGD